MSLSPRQRAKAAVIAAVGLPAMEALSATYQWHDRGTDHVRRIVAEGRQPIYALWHGRILCSTLYLRDRGVVVMTSENFDGEWIARIIRGFGFGTARGSTSRGGARALAEMRREMAAGRRTAFTVDGPRGPARVAQPGAVWLASITGNPIIPFHPEASSYWTVNSWDRHQVPRPGSDVVAGMGPAIEVPRHAGDQAIEEGRVAVEQALGRLEREARAMLGRSV